MPQKLVLMNFRTATACRNTSAEREYTTKDRLWLIESRLIDRAVLVLKDIYLILLSVFLGAVGQVAFKYGATHLPDTGSVMEKVVAAWPITVGLAVYGVSTLLWIYALRTVELSYAYPLISLGYILVFIASYFLFHEAIGLLRMGGLVLILSGIVLVANS
jgi:multidrug transporter EmrE-like cation transporter